MKGTNLVFGKEKRPEPDAIEAMIGARATFSGNLRCDGSIRIDGVVESGAITTPTNVIITASARVMAEIQAKVVSVSGAFKGTITAERVELLEGGRIWGTVKVASFLLDEGGYLRGELIMQGEEPQQPFLIPPPAGPKAQIPVSEGNGSARAVDRA